MKRRPYRIDYTPEAEDHLALLSAGQSKRLLDAVIRQLTFEPTLATRNRKILRANPLAPWELRVRDFRVYYEVEADPERIVVVKAIGVKHRDRVRIGGEEVKL